MTNEIYYKKVGVRKLSNFIDPFIMVDTDAIWPISSELHWFNISPVSKTPTNDIGYLQNAERPAVITVFEYVQPIGNFINKEVTIKQIISNNKKKNPAVKYIPLNSKKIKLNNRKLLIYDYGSLNAVHPYRPYQLMKYDQWLNSTNVLMYSINKSNNNRHKYIIFHLPPDIPNKLTLDKYAKDKVTIKTLEYFPTHNHLSILDLWKLLTPSLIKESQLFKINRKILNDITIMFVYNNKYSLLNLGLLINFIKEYEGPGNIKQSADVIRKLVLIFITKIVKEPSSDISDNIGKDIKLGRISIIEDVEDLAKDKIKVNLDTELENLEDDYVEDISISKIADETLDQEETVSDNELFTTEYKTVNDLLKEDPDKTLKETIKSKTGTLLEHKLMSKTEYNNINKYLDDQKTAKNPYGEGKLSDMLVITKEDLDIPDKLTTIPDIDIIHDKEYLKDPIDAMDRHYINKVYKKDILSTLYSIQRADVIIKSHDIAEESSILGDVEIHTLEVKPLFGKPSKIVMRLPVIDEDGAFSMSGNKYKLRKQRSDIPIRKIDSNRVALSSYYGKNFITKATYKKDDEGFWFRKQLMLKAESNRKIKNIVLMPTKLIDVTVPNLYTIITRYVKMFTLDKTNYSFDFNKRVNLIGNNKDKLKKIEGSKYVLIGNILDTEYIVMDFNNNYFKVPKTNLNKYTQIDDLYTQLDIDVSKLPIEFASIKIFKSTIPVGLLLAYYVGLDNLLHLLKATYKKLDRNKRYTLEKDEYSLVFGDTKLILNKKDKLATIILAGLNSLNKHTKSIDYVMFNRRDRYQLLFNEMGLSLLYTNEFKLIEMFIDPVTKSVLEYLKLPVTFKGLLIKACELLLDGNYKNPNSADGMLIKGYERVSGMMYSELIRATREFNNKNTFSKSKVVVDPYAVWRSINDDSTSALIDDLNPISNLKQKEDLTYLGSGGRSKESMSMSTREYHASEVGTISESVKDSGDVGVSAYLSAVPKMTTIRGLVPENKGKLSPANILSTSALLAPDGDKDDPKRLNFSFSN